MRLVKKVFPTEEETQLTDCMAFIFIKEKKKTRHKLASGNNDTVLKPMSKRKRPPCK